MFLRVIVLVLALTTHADATPVSGGTSIPQGPDPTLGALGAPSRCWGYIGYPVAVDTEQGNVATGINPTCSKDMELAGFAIFNSLGELFFPKDETNVTILTQKKQCHAALTTLLCRRFFPPFGNNGTGDLRPAVRLCDLVTTSCVNNEVSLLGSIYSGSSPPRFHPWQIQFPGYSGEDYNPAAALGSFNLAATCSDSGKSTAGTTADSLSLVGAAWNTNLKPLFGFPSLTPDTSVLAAMPYRSSKCQTYSGTVCKGIVPDGYQLSVPPNFIDSTTATTDQGAIEAAFKEPGEQLFRIASSFVDSDGESCRSLLVNLACSYAAPKCEVVSGVVSSSVLASKALCDKVFAKCPSAITDRLAESPIFVTSCSIQTNPHVSSFINEGGRNLPGNCTIAGAIESVTIPLFWDNFPLAPGGEVNGNQFTNPSDSTILATLTCPLPTIKTDDPFHGLGGGACALPCPSLIFTQEQYDNVDRMLQVLTSVGLVMITIQICTFFFFKRARSKKKYNVYFTLMVMFTNLSLFFVWAAEHDPDVPGIYAKARCVDRVHPRRDKYCLWMSVSLLFGALSAVNWWMVQALDLYLSMAWGARKWSKDSLLRKDICYFLWAWGWPLLTLIVAISENDLGNSVTGIPWCFFLGDTIGWVMFYSPILVQLLVGAVIILFIIYQLWKSSMALKSHRKKGWWRLYIKPLMFVVIIEIVWMSVFAFRFDAVFTEDQLREDAGKFVGCRLAGNSEDVCESTGNGRPQPKLALWYFLNFCIGGTGIWTFMLYFTGENYAMWYHFLTCKKYNFSRTSGTSGSTTDGSTTSQGTGTGGSRRVLRAKTGTAAQRLKKSHGGAGKAAAVPTALKKSTSTDSDAPPVLPPTSSLPALDRTSSRTSVQLANIAPEQPLPTNIAISYDDEPAGEV